MNSYFLIVLYLAALLALVKPLGWYMARVYQNESVGLNRWFSKFEAWLYRVSGINADDDMTWKDYALALLSFNVMGLVFVFVLQLMQGFLPLNPEQLPAVSFDLAINTAVSFVTNTNWQAYGGEATLSYLTQMLGLTVQNFVSAATGMAVLIVLIRGFIRHNQTGIGNFWVDMTRSVLYVLLPLSLLLSVLLVGQGVVQTLRPYQAVPLLEKTVEQSEQIIPLGAVASQVAIKQLGTNGGGFFNVNSAHPLENPTPISNFLEMLAILLIPAALCYSFGIMVGDTRQGWTMLAAMLLLLVPLLLLSVSAEHSINPQLSALNINQTDGNMEGKELRFGVTASAIWAVVTTAASNGSVNAMLDSFTPIGGMISMWLMQLGEVVFGGVGSGLYGMIVFALVAVFVAGLMIGRTPEYLGKKIEAFEMQMAAIIILIPPFLVLGGTALAVSLEVGKASVFNTGAHGFSEVLYAFSSAGNNNGSAFAGLSANTVFYNSVLAMAMFVSRFGLIVPVLAIAGSLAGKKSVPFSSGTLPTHTPLFVLLLVVIVIMVGALTFIPALALAPIVEHLQWSAS